MSELSDLKTQFLKFTKESTADLQTLKEADQKVVQIWTQKIDERTLVFVKDIKDVD